MIGFSKTNLTIKGSDVARYVFLPQVGPRIGQFVSAGFGNLAYFMVLVYRAVNLIQPNHHFLSESHKGQYTILDVITEAARNLTFDRKHMDQVIVFFALLAGMAILIIQFILLMAFMFMNPAVAADMPNSYAEFVETTGNTEDIALRMLDMVFGVPDIFNTNVETDTMFHKALRGMFQAYSIGLLVIAVLIVIYFIIAVVAETAQTGTPFGKRYNHAWVPIRLVVGIGLLIPISHGLNSAQWITLYSAKFGSGFATNGWVKFNETLNDTYIPTEETIATPTVTTNQFKDIAAFFMLAHACKEAYTQRYKDIGDNIDAYLIKSHDGGGFERLQTLRYIDAVGFAGESRVLRIRIGERNTGKYPQEVSNVFSYCGDITLTVPENVNRTTGMSAGGPWVNAGYYLVLQEMWQGNSGAYTFLKDDAEEMVKSRLVNTADAVNPDSGLKSMVLEEAQRSIEVFVRQGVRSLIEESEKPDINEIKKYGWGGAGLWYNTIADKNGALTTAAMNKPQITSYANIMEKVCTENRQQNSNTSQKDCYRMRIADGRETQVDSEKDKAIAKAMSDVFDYWYAAPDDLSANALIDVINAILGTEGLFSMCKNEKIHPLAQLTSLGKGLVESAIRNLGFGIGFGLGSLLPYVGPAMGAASGFAMTLGSIGILIGFILYYIIPFLPFLYFLFAVGGWVKGIFEAMVGVPLWALAHLRIDGQGLPGDAASGGYFLIFEVFIRPILIVFGLLASIIIFGAMVKVLNEIFYLAVSNMAGFDTEGATSCGATTPTGGGNSAPVGSIEYFRGPVDEFFFTIVYAILVYMIAMSSFKLIDMIPNGILRWMGQGIKTFGDEAGEPAEGIVQKMAIGGSLLKDTIGGVGGKLGEAVSNTAGAVASGLSAKK